MERHEFGERAIYVAADAEAWMATTLRAAARDRSRILAPYEQVDQLLHDFIIGRPMAYDAERKKLVPFGHHVWELRTLDVRLFGWFPRRRRFIVVSGNLKADLRQRARYAPYVAGVVAFRALLDLDEPKALTGVRADDIL